MNRFDQAARYAVKLDPPGLLSWWLRRTPDQLRFRHWLDTRGIVFPGEKDRTNDTVAWLADADPAIEWAVPVEFSLSPDEAMFGRLLIYLGTIWLEKRPTDAGKERYSVGALIVNLTGKGSASRKMRYADTELFVELSVVERDLETFDAAEILERIAAGELRRSVLPWIPLMRRADEIGIIERWKELAGQEPNARLRSDYGGLALVFSEAAKRLPLWKEQLKEWNVIESQQVLEWMAQGEAKGEARGEAKGATNSLLRLLQKRYAPLPSDLLRAILQTPDLSLLRTWFDLALETDSLADFQQRAGL